MTFFPANVCANARRSLLPVLSRIIFPAANSSSLISFRRPLNNSQTEIYSAPIAPRRREAAPRASSSSEAENTRPPSSASSLASPNSTVACPGESVRLDNMLTSLLDDMKTREIFGVKPPSASSFWPSIGQGERLVVWRETPAFSNAF